VEPAKKIAAVLVSKRSKLLEEQQESIKRIARIESLTIQNEKYDGGQAGSAFTKHAEVHVPLEGLIDVAKENERLTKEKSQLEKFLKGVQGKLKNKEFVKSAPEEVVAKEKQKETDAQEKLEKVEGKLAMLSSSR